MKICHVIDYFHSDVGYQEYYLALAQAEAGHDVRVLTTTERHHTVRTVGPDDEAGAQRLVDAGVDVVRRPARQLGHDRAWIMDLEAALSTFMPDAIHCHGPFAPTTLRVARWANDRDVSLLVDNHIQEFIAPGSKTPIGRAVYTGFRYTAAPWLRRRVDEWVAIGPYEADFLARHMGLEIRSIGLIPLGFDPTVFRYDAARRAALRAERGWDDALVVAVTGKLHRGKATHLTAEAVEEVGTRRPVRLVLAGTIDDDYLRVVRSASPSLTSSGHLEVLPMLGRADLADLYLAADVAVFARLPSISIYEAAGTGATVLVGRDRFAEWLDGIHSGIRAIDLSQLRRELDAPRADRADLAREATERFSWPVISNEFVRRYRSRRV